MSFADNLIYLRQHYGVTQETLAEQLGVSRQTVSKWEAGINFPETEKLLALCNLYHTNLDDLMRGSVRVVNEQDTDLYDAHMNHYNLGISLVGPLILVGVGILLLLEAQGIPDNISTAALLSFVVIAVVIAIIAGMNHGEFKRKHAKIKPRYDEAVLDRFRRHFPVMIAAGVGLILLDIIFLTALFPDSNTTIDIFGIAASEDLFMGPFLFILALAIGIITWAGMQKDKYDKTTPAQGKEGLTDLEEFLFEQGNILTPQDLRRNHLVGSICGIIMILATIAFFVIGFANGATSIDDIKEWNNSGFSGESGFGYSWIAFVIGGLLCGVVAIIGNAIGKSDAALIAEARKEDPWIKIKEDASNLEAKDSQR